MQAGSFIRAPRLKKGIEHLGLQITLRSEPHSHDSLHPRSNFWPRTQSLPLTTAESGEFVATGAEVDCSVDVTEVDEEFWRNGDGIVTLKTVMFMLLSCICVGRIAVSSMSSKDKSWREPFSDETVDLLSADWCSCTSKFIARPCATPMLEFLDISSSVCGLRCVWPPSLGSEALTNGDLVFAEEVLL
jgi:hypothetical protein